MTKFGKSENPSVFFGCVSPLLLFFWSRNHCHHKRSEEKRRKETNCPTYRWFPHFFKKRVYVWGKWNWAFRGWHSRLNNIKQGLSKSGESRGDRQSLLHVIVRGENRPFLTLLLFPPTVLAPPPPREKGSPQAKDNYWKRPSLPPLPLPICFIEIWLEWQEEETDFRRKEDSQIVTSSTDTDSTFGG